MRTLGRLVLGAAGLALASGLALPGAAAAPGSAGAPGTPTPSGRVPTAVGQCTPEKVQYVAQEPPALNRLGARDAWRTATGAGIVVAVVDSGVDPANTHLTPAVLPGVDVVGLEGDPRGWTDTAGHGTAVAGIIAARPWEGSGLVGLAPDATILPVRVYYADDEQAVEAGVQPQTGRIAEGILWAVDNGARVVNVSISSTVDDPVLRDAVRVATERGALVVASAGNRTTAEDTTDSPRYPAAYDEVLAVTAVDAGDSATEDSIHGPHVEIAAPGTDVLTTFHAAGDCVLGGAASSSYATAYVSAAAALVAQAYPGERPAQWAHRLTVTAARFVADARDDWVGWGVVRPSSALAFVDDGSAPGPPSPAYEAPVVTPPRPADLELGAPEDVLAPAQAVSTWWLLGGVGACLAALVVSRLTGRRRRERAAAATT
ncbi:S8 family serine peptidase [Actinotalea solisilvae]|uniref:S8 family serine peptidase n=1 Tax=Actinotalea solisilvae TaxID=2072922 RepID=UPI0018F10D23|nr:S8 family serine peptidase [Actinotalea solisilvae]